PSDLARVVGPEAGDRLLERGADVVEVGDPLLLSCGVGLLELDPRVLAGDQDLGRLGRRVGQRAGPLDPADAGEVEVGAAVSPRLGEGEARAAARADERALEVVVVLSVALARGAVGG